jgi:SAM-dependent methyltransferase
MNVHMAVADAPPRPKLNERRQYLARSRQEEFIVPLVAQAVRAQLDEYHSEKVDGLTVLDVGCGGQPFKPLLTARGFEYSGMDVAATGAEPNFFGAVDEELPQALLEAGPFDLVLCTEVLEHVADWDAAFANLARLIRPGGRLIITCPHFYFRHEEPYDFWRPTLFALSHFARRAGLRIIYEERAGTAADVLGTLLGGAKFVCCGRMRLLKEAVAGALNYGLAFYRWLLKRAAFRSITKFEGRTYLTNVVVMETARGGQRASDPGTVDR